MKTAIGISTYLTNETINDRLSIIKKSIDSLVNTNYNGDIYIIDDGSNIKEHLEYIKNINDSRIYIIERKENGGIAKTKNTSIKLILENNDIGFLADDDVLYKNGWDALYENAIRDTKFEHFTLYVEDRKEIPIIKINNTNILKLPHIDGCFLTISKNIINQIGYFKIFPYKFGHEHSNFTIRCKANNLIPHYMDVENSNKYLSLVPESLSNRSLKNIDKTQFNANEKLIWDNIYEKERRIE